MRMRTGIIIAALLFLLATAAPANATPFTPPRATLVTGGFTQPVAFVQDPSSPSRQVVVEQTGHVPLLVNSVVQASDYLDLSCVVLAQGERGLLGFAFALDYATSGRVDVNFIDLSGNTVIARSTRASGDPLHTDGASRFDFLWPGGNAYIVQPYSNHNGGNLAFGPVGFLYIGMGDGGSGDDPQHNARWRNREGARPYINTLPPFSTPLVDPIFEYSHAEGRSVTGGLVYRGRRWAPASTAATCSPTSCWAASGRWR